MQHRLAELIVVTLLAAGPILAAVPLDDARVPPPSTVLYRAARIPSDRCFETCPIKLGGQSNLRAVGAPAAWDVTTGSPEVVVAVLDTLIDARHPELRGKVLVGPDLRPDLECVRPDALELGHGTAVASVVAAATDDATGIAGIGWSTRVLAVPVLDDCGVGTAETVAAGIAVAVDRGARIINLSLTGPAHPVVEDAVERARRRGVLVVAAAGNEGADEVTYPAAYRSVIAVGSTDEDNARLSPFSNRGAWVDLGAPGEDVLAAAAVAGGYWIYEGTSFSSPLVAGAAALLLAVHPHFDADDLAHSLADSARPTDGVVWGALDAGELLEQHAGALLLAQADGGVLTYGTAGFHGSLSGIRLAAPVVGIAATEAGYVLAGADGGVFAFGDAAYAGGMAGMRLRAPIVGIAAHPSGAGYWLVAADGGVFAYGRAPFLGSLGGVPLRSPVVGIVATPSGAGYWLAAADGGVFTFGDAVFAGSAAGRGKRIAGIAAAGPRAYRLVATDGSAWTFGEAAALQPPALRAPAAAIGIASAMRDAGYWIVSAAGHVTSVGHVLDDGRFRPAPASAVVGVAAPASASE